MVFWLTVALFSIFGLFILFLLFWRFIFLRDPDRVILAGNVLVSPADGKIIDVLHWKKDKIKDKITVHKLAGSFSVVCSDVSGACFIVPIFMSPFDVHVNRAPSDCTVLSLKYTKGSFRAANKLALANERNELLLQTSLGRVKVVQVAGFLARRIECWLSVGEKLSKGQRFGRINLGSQVIMIMPDSVKLKVKPHDKVKAGETVIASKASK